MRSIVLFDLKDNFENLLPLTFTRPVADLRVGITKISEKWRFYDKNLITGFYPYVEYLREKFPIATKGEAVFVNSAFIPDQKLFEAVFSLREGEALQYSNGELLAFRSINYKKIITNNDFAALKITEYDGELIKISSPWDIFSVNGQVLESDFLHLTQNRKSKPLSDTVNIINKENVFAEENVDISFATLNAQNGYIYLANGVTVMEGTLVRGSLAMCEHSQLKLGAKVYGPTTIGPYSKVGGEVNNVVIQGYSNKAHDGFLGNAVIGEWCNIGADSNNSNLKNNYAEVKMWNYKEERFIKTGLQFCGLIMADHSKCGINTMFNTGTVVGVNANIFGSGFPRNFIPSFSWGGAQGFTEYKLSKALEVAEKVMKRRNKLLDEKEKNILTAVFELTSKYRKK